MTTPKIGVIGLGNMGRGIADNFAKAGHATAVWDLNAGARAPFEARSDTMVMSPG